MGRKGVSKRKPKQQKSTSKGNGSGSVPTRAGGNRLPALVSDKSVPLNSGRMNPSSGSNKKHKNGK